MSSSNPLVRLWFDTAPVACSYLQPVRMDSRVARRAGGVLRRSISGSTAGMLSQGPCSSTSGKWNYLFKQRAPQIASQACDPATCAPTPRRLTRHTAATVQLIYCAMTSFGSVVVGDTCPDDLLDWDQRRQGSYVGRQENSIGGPPESALQPALIRSSSSPEQGFCLVKTGRAIRQDSRQGCPICWLREVRVESCARRHLSVLFPAVPRQCH